ncbi:MAG: branched-chain amino acid ABC transporter permease [Lentisphaerae bacterium]|nr:branched-chain amino acid ABC transporter permease [Lentisphaerota bacterium]
MLWQLTINGVIAGAVYALVGIGFALIYNTAKFFHFAHGAVFTLGAYFTLVLANGLGLPLLLAFPIAVILAALLGCSLEMFVFASIRRKGGSPLVLLLSSLGLYVILQNLISICFGDGIKTLRTGVVKGGMELLGARITPVQVSIIAASVILLVTLVIFLRSTKIGKAMRATSSDARLADVCGINSGRVMVCAFGIGSALTAVAGILVALDVDMTPTMGLNALMMGIVAVIIGGRHSVLGIALGALLLGMAQHLGVWYIGSQWQDAIAFFILLAFLLVRPEGVMGKKLRKATA